ncbi:polysaccharide deacetylase family protein [Feifania hominis]|uniref:Polysaccharide deacetylase family protein n=1 Tax=Feifania hominis TaxID=2763660 RepID=A0A926DCR2_9FIRM|nr:polysaccharide deacetylase family protein [Feifania hominis]MBC8536575.1 polysaccharide deacetylase family protein [Feifania hominis]
MRMRNSRRPLVIGLVLILCCCLVSSVWQMIREEIFSPPALSTGAQVHADGIELPIIMYHHFSENKSRLGDYVLSVDKFESDLKYIRDNGFTTVTVADLIAYVYDGVPLPEKPIMLTFDDGYESNYVYAYPLLKEYGMKGVLSVIGLYADKYTDEPDHNVNYAHCTWDQLAEMERSGVMEIQSHSYNMHSHDKGRTGTLRCQGESVAQYIEAFRADAELFESRSEQMLGHKPTAYTYPFGDFSKESITVLREMGYKVSFGVYEKLNYITDDPEGLYLLHRFNRPNKYSTEKFFSKLLAG